MVEKAPATGDAQEPGTGPTHYETSSRLFNIYYTSPTCTFLALICTFFSISNTVDAMFQEFKIARDDVMPLRHFDDDNMSFESFQFRRSGPKVRIPTSASQPRSYEEATLAVEYDSNNFYPNNSVTHRPPGKGAQQRKRCGSEEQENIVVLRQAVVDGKVSKKSLNNVAKQMMKWFKNPALELEELTGWKYTPISYSFVFLVGIGCGILYHGWLTDMASNEVSYTNDAEGA